MEKFTASYILPADVETAFKLMLTEDYFVEKYKTMQAQNVAVELLEDTDEAFSMAVERDVTLGESVPGFAKKLVGDSMRLHQTVTWQKTEGPVKRGEFNGRLMGKDGGVHAELFLEPDGELTIMRIEGKIEVSVPLIGRKIEKLMAERSSDAFEYDLEATAQYIDQHKA